jgi:hypothetical protein
MEKAMSMHTNPLSMAFMTTEEVDAFKKEQAKLINKATFSSLPFM